jgi:anthranilate synthase
MITDEAIHYATNGGIGVTRHATTVEPGAAVDVLIGALDDRLGVLLSSSYEYPGRYTRWDLGFVDPPLVLSARSGAFTIEALNDRGRVLLSPVAAAVGALASVTSTLEGDTVAGRIVPSDERVPEEERSRRPSTFQVVRALRDLFAAGEDPHLGLYGSFGYDLAFEFEPIERRIDRPGDQRDLVLYIPDSLLVVDHQAAVATRYDYEFTVGATTTADRTGGGGSHPFTAADRPASRDHEAGEYAGLVEVAREKFACGDLFEVVPSMRFTEPTTSTPAELFTILREQNPAPYGFLINLGRGEFLVGASPEMYVRVEGDRVETCPISGTIARGDDPIGDASQILALLNSDKDESELTMCTDVDRNDKSRICVPGSVKVIGRRQVEMYSRLIHTVDHVEGRLRPGYDALDAFLTHTWAVTVTGAPKAWAMQFIEDNERTPRAWYGGAVGRVGFDGGLNTGLTLRTIHMRDGMAHLRVGATLLYHSDPEAEEAETALKASAFLDAIRHPGRTRTANSYAPEGGEGLRIVLVDHRDSFVHTLANYLRCTGAEVTTWRAGFDPSELADAGAGLVVLSPGPGRPDDFAVSATVEAALAAGLPIFGVCLGLQGVVEHFGGTLSTLEPPMHGRASDIHVTGGRLFTGMPATFEAGRYHSLYARPDDVPAELEITATGDDGNVVMAVEHRDLPIAAVQFHPESIMSLGDDVGLRLVDNAVRALRA